MWRHAVGVEICCRPGGCHGWGQSSPFTGQRSFSNLFFQLLVLLAESGGGQFTCCIIYRQIKRILIGLCWMQLLWRQWALLGSFTRDRLPHMKQFYARKKEDALESNKHHLFKALIITWHCLIVLQLLRFLRNAAECHLDSFAGNFSGVLNSNKYRFELQSTCWTPGPYILKKKVCGSITAAFSSCAAEHYSIWDGF